MPSPKRPNCARSKCVSGVFSRGEMSGTLPRVHFRDVISSKDVRNGKIVLDKVDWQKIGKFGQKQNQRLNQLEKTCQAEYWTFCPMHDTEKDKLVKAILMEVGVVFWVQ